MTVDTAVSKDRLKEIIPNLTTYMPDRLIGAVGAASQERHVAPGETVIAEGETSTEFFLIREGTFGIYRAAPGGGTEVRVAEIGPGQPFGEMALLDGEPRAATVRAESAGVILEIAPEALRAQPDGEAGFLELKGALAAFVTRRMRATTQGHVEALQRELALRKEQEQFGRFFIYSLTMMSIGTIVNNMLARMTLSVDIYTQIFAWQYLAVLLVPSFFVIRHMGISLQSLGLTTVGLKRSLSEGALISVGLFALTWIVAAILRHFDALPGKVLPFDLLGTLSYFLHSALQEIIARGFLQSSFQRFLGDSNGLWSVLLASILFGMFHLHFGMAAVLMTIATGCVFGLIYMRHQNVAGVTLVHYVMGVAAFNTGLI
ncbi:cyclic nucleotide-binding domain-containing protein [Pseudodonghicola flavimaris]|uniref:Cyclic nucleotide-binding domain-containing protein n=1 Tax=Pseudodonghicola flavimaris TaxID=3050036 RepID=A0ABT7EY63_9RHOB|nr:cyclic nucleotide-binding domain-containing protein [Pseudodonghicola flavimaris]MDK3017289.1 cyclic nucleotide-binding domain-containing protein [Pseudodonghicola flavimaris]